MFTVELAGIPSLAKWGSTTFGSFLLPRPSLVKNMRFLLHVCQFFSGTFGCTCKDCRVVQIDRGSVLFHTFKLHHCPDFYPPAMTNQFGVTVRYCGYILFSMSVLVCYICLCFGKECQNLWSFNRYLSSSFILDLAKVIGDYLYHQGIPGTIQGITLKARQRSASLCISQLQVDQPVANGLL